MLRKISQEKKIFLWYHEVRKRKKHSQKSQNIGNMNNNKILREHFKTFLKIIQQRVKIRKIETLNSPPKFPISIPLSNIRGDKITDFLISQDRNNSSKKKKMQDLNTDMNRCNEGSLTEKSNNLLTEIRKSNLENKNFITISRKKQKRNSSIFEKYFAHDVSQIPHDVNWDRV